MLCLLLALAFCLALTPAAAASGEPSEEAAEAAAVPEAEAIPEEAADAEAPPAFDGASNEETVYGFLTGTMGLNTAAACGILATIYGESRFDPNVTGDSGTSFGICQWHDWGSGVGRYTNLRDYCAGHGYDYHTLDGQLHYLQYELDQYGFTGIRDKMYTFPNTARGAYDAGYYWCYYFGVPADRENVSKQRGELARDTFWPRYAGAAAAPCVVSFDADGGTAVGSVSVNAGEHLTALPASTRAGYTFGGWYAQKNGGGARLTTDTVISENVTWYARWDADRCTVAFDTQGAGDLAAVSVTCGEPYGTLPMPGRPGYRFDGWFTAPTGGRQITGETTVTAAGDHTLYAHWTLFMTFTVHYDANGGAGEPMPQQKLFDVELTLTKTRPRRDGYVFLGWAAEPDAAAADYAPGDPFRDNRSAVLYAVWQRAGGDTPADAASLLAGGGSALDAANILRSCVGK